jgi:hypothetical protein
VAYTPYEGKQSVVAFTYTEYLGTVNTKLLNSVGNRTSRVKRAWDAGSKREKCFHLLFFGHLAYCALEAQVAAFQHVYAVGQTADESKILLRQKDGSAGIETLRAILNVLPCASIQKARLARHVNGSIAAISELVQEQRICPQIVLPLR